MKGFSKTINGKIIISFLGSLIIGILIISIIATFSAIGFANNTANLSSEELINAELDNLDRNSESKAQVVNGYFDEFVAQVKFLAGYAEDLFNGRITAEPRKSFYGDLTSTSDQSVPPMVYSTKHNLDVSYEYSGWYMANIGTVEADVTNADWEMVNISSNLDYAFKVLFNQNPYFLWSYMGFETGLHRTYPYKDISSWKTKEFANARDGGTVVGYDPRIRQYYVDAKAKGTLVIPQPQKDPTLGITKITISHPAYFDNGSLIGVVGADLTIDAIEQTVSDLKVLDNGYAFIIDENKYAVMHPKIDRTKQLQYAVNLEITRPREIDRLDNILEKAANQEIGSGSFEKDGEKWYISYYPISTAKFSLLLVVPETDIIAAANEVKSQIIGSLFGQLGTYLLIILILSVITLGLASYSSHRIVDPIRELTEVSEHIAKGNLTRNLKGSGGGSSEIQTLYNTFRGLLTALRFGNEQYYAGNVERAMDNYLNALELFESVDNQKGIGICYNNIGNIHRAKDNMKDANKAYRKAIDIAKELLANTEDNEDKREHYLALASRYNNLGLLYKYIEEYEKGEEYIKQALEYDREVDNARGFATRYGNLGQIYMAMGKMEDARAAFDEAWEIANSYNNSRAIAYAMFNYGLYQRQLENYDEAVKYFLDASEKAQDLDVRVIQSSLLNVQEIYELKGETELVKEMEEKIKSLVNQARVKNVYFVLDYSGSMAGKRIKQALRGIESLFKTQINELDTVALITFDSNSRYVVSPQVKGEGDTIRQFMFTLDTLNTPSGSTAFYDALGLAYEKIQGAVFGTEKWIIALTDGNDNTSKQHTSQSISQLAREEFDINLVIIGVGDLGDRNTLQSICKSTDRGRYINVTEDLGNTIETAFEEVSSMLSEVEVEGFVPDY